MITEESLMKIFKEYEDPELHIDIWTLGLVYEHTIAENKVNIKLTFTSPFCPFGPQMVEELEEQIKAAGADEVKITITFDPPWKPSDELKAMLGMV